MPTENIYGSDIYYQVDGTGDPLLLLPGLGRGTSYYDAVTPHLVRHYSVIRVDPRGIGRSSRGPLPYTAEAWGNDFAVLLERLGLSRAHVVGSSHGASMAMALTDAHPSKVRSLVLFGAFAALDRFIELNVRLRMRLAQKLDMGEDMRDFIALWTFGHKLLEQPEADRMLEAGLAAVREHTPENYIALCQSMLDWGHRRPSFLERLPSFKCPTLVACGDGDYWIPAQFSRAIADRIPGARYVELQGCGHVPVREQPAVAADLIVRFLSEVADR